MPLIETTLHSGLEALLAAELAQFQIIPMSDRADWTLQKRLLLGALVCAVTLIAGYFIFVSHLGDINSMTTHTLAAER